MGRESVFVSHWAQPMHKSQSMGKHTRQGHERLKWTKCLVNALIGLDLNDVRLCDISASGAKMISLEGPHICTAFHSFAHGYDGNSIDDLNEKH